MHIRRPLAGLFVALTLFAGGGAMLTGCTGPANSRVGTPADTSVTTSGSSPSNPSQGNLPDNSNREPSSSSTDNGVGNQGG